MDLKKSLELKLISSLEYSTMLIYQLPLLCLHKAYRWKNYSKVQIRKTGKLFSALEETEK